MEQQDSSFHGIRSWGLWGLSSRGLIIWLLAATFFLYEFFLRTFVGTLAHQIITDLALNAETFALVGVAYYIGYGCMQIPAGVLADKFDLKYVLGFAVLLCALSAFLFSQATALLFALFSRFLMGLGSSFAFVCLLVVVMRWFPRKLFAFFAGVSQFIGTLGPLLAGGPLMVLVSAYQGHWREPLMLISALGFLLALLIFLIVKNKAQAERQSIMPNQALLKVQLVHLIKNPQVWYVAFYSASIYISITLLGAIWGTDYLEVRGFSQRVAADIISLTWFGYALGCPLLGVLSDLTKRRKPVLIGCAILGLLITLCITYISWHSAWSYGVLF